MEFITFLFILALVLLCFKALGLILKTGFFLLSLPILIIASIVVAVVIFALIPVALVTGLIAVILAPIGLLAPVLPLLLIGFGIYLLVKR